MHLLSDLTLSSKDFAENMRTYWNTNFHNYETLFSLDSYYPYGSQCFSNANLYFGINCGDAENPGLLQLIEAAKPTETKLQWLFIYKEFTPTTVLYNPTFTWKSGSSVTDLLNVGAVDKLVMLECQDQYFVDIDE